MPMPIPDPDAPWPSCDDQQPGLSIRPLSHGDLAALLAHLHQHDQDLDGDPAWPDALAPVVAVRVRATVGQPGASAQATYRHHRAAEWAAWTRSLPWRAVAVLAAGVGIGLLAAQVLPHLAGPAGLLAAAALAWLLRFRVSPATSAWRRGAAGERHTARLLRRLEQRGWVVLHDLAVPGSRANIDHLAIGPGGVVVIDSKQYGGGCVSMSLGCCCMAATCSLRPCGRCGGRPTRPTRCSALPTSRSARSSPCTAPTSPGAAWRSTASPSPPPAELLTFSGLCRHSLGPSG
jgi:Nuclease-related domain